METFVAWCSFIGAWLLVAGSIYQAVLELKDEDIERGRIRDRQHKVNPIPKVSAWWWFIPPVKFYLERRRSEAYRNAYLNTLTDEEIESLVSFINKSSAWIFVAGGGILIAIKETYELIRPEGFQHILLFTATVVGLFFLSVINTAFRMRRSKDILKRTKDN